MITVLLAVATLWAQLSVPNAATDVARKYIDGVSETRNINQEAKTAAGSASHPGQLCLGDPFVNLSVTDSLALEFCDNADVGLEDVWFAWGYTFPVYDDTELIQLPRVLTTHVPRSVWELYCFAPGNGDEYYHSGNRAVGDYTRRLAALAQEYAFARGCAFAELMVPGVGALLYAKDSEGVATMAVPFDFTAVALGLEPPVDGTLNWLPSVLVENAVRLRLRERREDLREWHFLKTGRRLNE